MGPLITGVLQVGLAVYAVAAVGIAVAWRAGRL